MSTTQSSRQLVLSLYKNLLREGSKFPSYNYREYVFRRTRDAFRDNKHLTDDKAIKAGIEEGIESLETVRRQVVIGNLYKADKLVIEK